jgi:signal peptidase
MASAIVWVRRAARAAAIGIVVLCFLTLALLGIGPRIFGYRTLTVLSGSMRPVMPIGSVVITTREPIGSLRVGDILVYQAPIADHRVVSHRVVSIKASGGGAFVVQTKGDANASPDPWLARVDSPSVWHVRAVIPGLGNAIRLLRARQLHLALLYLVPFMLAAIWLSEIWRRSPDVEAPVVHA